MANVLTAQTLLDLNKRAVIKFTGTFDGSGQETANTKIIGSLLRGALAVDANNNVLVSQGGSPRSNYVYSIQRIVYDMNIPNGYLTISFDGAVPAPAASIHAPWGDLNSQSNLGIIQNNAGTPNGNVTFTTVNAQANNSYTVLVEIIKDPSTYDMGQFARPADFNQGPLFNTKP